MTDRQYWPYVLCALLVIIILGTAYCSGRQSKLNEMHRKANSAINQTSSAKARDAVKAEQQEKELTDVLQTESDPDRQRVLRGCLILRQQGKDIRRIPACR